MSDITRQSLTDAYHNLYANDDYEPQEDDDIEMNKEDAHSVLYGLDVEHVDERLEWANIGTFNIEDLKILVNLNSCHGECDKCGDHVFAISANNEKAVTHFQEELPRGLAEISINGVSKEVCSDCFDELTSW